MLYKKIENPYGMMMRYLNLGKPLELHIGCFLHAMQVLGNNYESLFFQEDVSIASK